MARPKKTITPIKEKRIMFRVTDELYDVIANEATAAKLTVSEYCRKVCTDKRLIVKKEKVFDNPELLSALSNIGKIGSNLNQIARHLNEGNSIDTSLRKELLQYITELRSIREEIKEMAGEYRGGN